MGIRGRCWSPSRITSRFGITRSESSVMAMTANTGKKPIARIVSHFIQLWQNGTIDDYRTATALTVVFFLLLTLVIHSFATVYTVDYASQVAATVIMMPLVVLVLQYGVITRLTARTVAG